MDYALLTGTAAVVESLPFSFEYGAYRKIAASHGLTKYEQVRVEQPWRPAAKKMAHVVEDYLQTDHNITERHAVDHILEQLVDKLEPRSYAGVTSYLVSQFGASQGRAEVLAKVFARNQPMLVNVEAVIDAVEKQYRIICQ